MAQEGAPQVDAVRDGDVQIRAREVRVGRDRVGERDREEAGVREVGAHEVAAREIGTLEIDAREVEAREVLPGEVGWPLGRGHGEGREHLLAREALLGGRGPGGDAGGRQREDQRPEPSQAASPLAHGLLGCRSDCRCGRPGLTQPSLRAFTYWYSS